MSLTFSQAPEYCRVLICHACTTAIKPTAMTAARDRTVLGHAGEASVIVEIYATQMNRDGGTGGVPGCIRALRNR